MGLIPALAKSSKLRGMPSVAFAVSNKNSLKLPLVTGEDYIESLRGRGLTVYLFGKMVGIDCRLDTGIGRGDMS